jgi:hypothetical protein
MKIFIWALYLPDYPNLLVEVRVGDRDKPDVVSVYEAAAIGEVNGRFLFWGSVGQDKIFSLTHDDLSVWGRASRDQHRLSFNFGSAERRC